MSTPELAVLPPGRTIAEAIATALRADIISGRLTAGTRLRQVELAERFAVSTTPVREAFGILQHEGLVRMHPQRGATVFVPLVQDLEEHYEIRTALESLAIEKAAQNFKPADTPPLRKILDEMRSCADPEAYLELNHRFHMSLYRISKREQLMALISGLRNASAAYLQIYAAEGVPSDRLDREHEEILTACEAHDPSRATRALRHHLAETVNHVTNHLNHGQSRATSVLGDPRQ